MRRPTTVAFLLDHLSAERYTEKQQTTNKLALFAPFPKSYQATYKSESPAKTIEETQEETFFFLATLMQPYHSGGLCTTPMFSLVLLMNFQSLPTQRILFVCV